MTSPFSPPPAIYGWYWDFLNAQKRCVKPNDKLCPSLVCRCATSAFRNWLKAETTKHVSVSTSLAVTLIDLKRSFGNRLPDRREFLNLKRSYARRIRRAMRFQARFIGVVEFGLTRDGSQLENWNAHVHGIAISVLDRETIKTQLADSFSHGARIGRPVMVKPIFDKSISTDSGWMDYMLDMHERASEYVRLSEAPDTDALKRHIKGKSRQILNDFYAREGLNSFIILIGLRNKEGSISQYGKIESVDCV